MKIEVSKMDNGKYIVHEGSYPISGIAGCTKKEAEKIAENIKEQRRMQKLRVSELNNLIKNSPSKQDSDNAYHALKAKRAKRLAGRNN